MNIAQLKKNVGWWLELRPPAIGLTAQPALWFLQSIDLKDRVALLQHATGHVLKLGGDHIKSFMADPNRGHAMEHYGFLQLDVQVTVNGVNVSIDPIQRTATNKRAITGSVREHMIRILRPVGPTRIAFASTHGDLEAHDFKLQLLSVFRAAEWVAEDLETFMFFGVQRGLVMSIALSMPEVGPPQLALQALSLTGGPVTANRSDVASQAGIYVQVWHAL